MDDFPTLLPWFSRLVPAVIKESGSQALEVVAQYITEVRDDVSPKAMYDVLEAEAGPEAAEVAMTIAERLRADGRAGWRRA